MTDIEKIKEHEYARGWNDALATINPCGYRLRTGEPCGRPATDSSVHPQPGEPKGLDRHVFRSAS